MSKILGRRDVVPEGLSLVSAEVGPEEVSIAARAVTTAVVCPQCGEGSRSIHSRYQRSFADLPAHGRRVRLRLEVRRCRCVSEACGRKIFAERLDPSIAAPFARRTARLEGIVHHLGVALGGRPGQATARRLLTPVSKETLLRVVRKRASMNVAAGDPAPRVVGIDDWAWRKGHR